MQAPEYGEHAVGPAQDEEFVLAHADNVEAAGFVSHLKLPHYVDFQAELELLKWPATGAKRWLISAAITLPTSMNKPNA
ncbi:carbon-phosphorus lyase complex subunit PhnI [Escherichia coli]